MHDPVNLTPATQQASAVTALPPRLGRTVVASCAAGFQPAEARARLAPESQRETCTVCTWRLSHDDVRSGRTIHLFGNCMDRRAAELNVTVDEVFDASRVPLARCR
jgi:hypothetical protein